MPFKNPLLRAFVLNIFVLFLCLGIGGLRYGCLDDFYMASVVTGAYGGEFDAHTLFVNGVYAYFLKPFYDLIPAVGWYFIFQLLFVFVSFVAITHSLLIKVSGKYGIILALFILGCLSPIFYLQMGFTQTAAALTAAGIVQMYLGNFEKKWTHLVFGSLLMILGVVFRKEGFLLGVPFLFLVLTLSWFELKKIQWNSVVALVGCFVAFLWLQSFNMGLFQNEEYSYYMNYQWPRSALGDGAFYDEQDVFDELEELGKSGRDFNLLTKWVFYDTEAFSLNRLQEIVDVVHRNSYDLNYVKIPVALFFVVANSFFGTSAWCWGFLCLLLFFCAPRRASIYSWGTLALISVCLGYLLMQNRVVSHVENSIWLYAIVCFVPFVQNKNLDIDKRSKIPALTVLLALGCFVFSMANQCGVENDRLFFGSPKKSEDLSKFLQYTRLHTDDVFLIPFYSYKEIALYDRTPYKAVLPREYGNLIPIGYWNINLPGMKKELAERNVQNPLRDIVKENVFVMDEDFKLQLERLHKRHYGKDVVVDTVRSFGDKKLLKYRLGEGE